jgi:hypothetical protein
VSPFIIVGDDKWVIFSKSYNIYCK